MKTLAKIDESFGDFVRVRTEITSKKCAIHYVELMIGKKWKVIPNGLWDFKSNANHQARLLRQTISGYWDN